jgi:ribonuclease BN (tRNA processing enzyme)
MKLTFLGVGGAFAPLSMGQSNMILTSDMGKIMMVDCGMSAPYIFRDEMKLNVQDVDALYVSHLHADHIGGIEWLGFMRYFVPKKDKDGNVIKPKLFMVPDLMKELWETSLKGGMQSIEGRIMNLTDYFDCIPVGNETPFKWEGYTFNAVQTIHVMSGYMFKHSYGLMIQNPFNQKTFITTDTQFCPYQLNTFYQQAGLIFHDCETLPFKSHVHAHYDDLKTLPAEIKDKMYLYHYQSSDKPAKADGFQGFVVKGQEFSI